jgi:hypothetical protein
MNQVFFLKPRKAPSGIPLARINLLLLELDQQQPPQSDEEADDSPEISQLEEVGVQLFISSC